MKHEARHFHRMIQRTRRSRDASYFDEHDKDDARTVVLWRRLERLGYVRLRGERNLKPDLSAFSGKGIDVPLRRDLRRKARAGKLHFCVGEYRLTPSQKNDPPLRIGKSNAWTWRRVVAENAAGLWEHEDIKRWYKRYEMGIVSLMDETIMYLRIALRDRQRR